jgi:hypothetical protein
LHATVDGKQATDLGYRSRTVVMCRDLTAMRVEQVQAHVCTLNTYDISERLASTHGFGLGVFTSLRSCSIWRIFAACSS